VLILSSSGKPYSIGVHGEHPGVLDRKRWIDDVIKMAALRARISIGLNAFYPTSIRCVDGKTVFHRRAW